jgi:hypothetical protein
MRIDEFDCTAEHLPVYRNGIYAGTENTGRCNATLKITCTVEELKWINDWLLRGEALLGVPIDLDDLKKVLEAASKATK